MPVRTKVEPIESYIALVVREDLSPAAQSKAIADFARVRLDEAEQVNKSVLGRIPPHSTAVDGRPGVALEGVKPDGGVIVFEFELVSDVLIWIAKTLQDRSPMSSGAYKRGHTVFADGREIKLGGNIPPAQEYSFTNLVPYARKIEIGKTQAGRAFVLQVPNRIYERTARDANGRFGNIAKILFTYRGIVGGAQINPRKVGATAIGRGANGRFVVRGGVRSHNASSARFPTITVTLN